MMLSERERVDQLLSFLFVLSPLLSFLSGDASLYLDKTHASRQTDISRVNVLPVSKFNTTCERSWDVQKIKNFSNFCCSLFCIIFKFNKWLEFYYFSLTKEASKKKDGKRWDGEKMSSYQQKTASTWYESECLVESISWQAHACARIFCVSTNFFLLLFDTLPDVRSSVHSISITMCPVGKHKSDQTEGENRFWILTLHLCGFSPEWTVERNKSSTNYFRIFNGTLRMCLSCGMHAYSSAKLQIIKLQHTSHVNQKFITSVEWHKFPRTFGP